MVLLSTVTHFSIYLLNTTFNGSVGFTNIIRKESIPSIRVYTSVKSRVLLSSYFKKCDYQFGKRTLCPFFVGCKKGTRQTLNKILVEGWGRCL